MPKIPMPNGQMVDAIEMEVADSMERWNTISLVNGDTIRIKNVTMSVFAIPGAKDQAGNQMYVVNSTQVMKVMKDLPRATLDDPTPPPPPGETPPPPSPGPGTGA